MEKTAVQRRIGIRTQYGDAALIHLPVDPSHPAARLSGQVAHRAGDDGHIMPLFSQVTGSLIMPRAAGITE